MSNFHQDELRTFQPAFRRPPRAGRPPFVGRGNRGASSAKFPRPVPTFIPFNRNDLNVYRNISPINPYSAQQFPLPLSNTSQDEEFSNLKKQLAGALQKIDNQRRYTNGVTFKLEQLKVENSSLKLSIQQQTAVNTSNAVTEQEANTMKLEFANLKRDNELKDSILEIRRLRITDLEKELETVVQEKVQSEAEKIEKIESLTNEKKSLMQENSTIKLLNDEMTEEVQTLTMLTAEMSIESSQKSEPETALESELQDTTCVICTEEMRLKKCTPCRRRFHKSCIENWLQRQNSCPACRAIMHS